ncbi:hypothetical protein PHLGIDRAFT_11367 [Phlebiopsis gigantea 11061_1 CR5-6]|uniref:DUF6533 domain-containing protein n=1 Tax=Phlebiopsis gigantea (strain 11061_1 CR5-6) TaxID=745531 RepID=A0A0C3NXY1_PHLG1|nr:hypothetical protein PHLGIDRAFT_11367 [Phlebiopsis gigantea 11061_1 CR5-6]
MDSSPLLSIMVIDDYLMLAGFSFGALLIYDHVITFDSEYCYIWGNPYAISSIAYWTIRCLGLISAVAGIVVNYLPDIPVRVHLSPRFFNVSSPGLTFGYQGLGLYFHPCAFVHHVSALAAAVITGSMRSRRVLTALVVVGLASFAIFIYSLTGQQAGILALSGCNVALSPERSYHLISKLSAVRTYKNWRQYTPPGRISLHTLLLRDASAIAGVQCANIATFYVRILGLTGGCTRSFGHNRKQCLDRSYVKADYESSTYCSSHIGDCSVQLESKHGVWKDDPRSRRIIRRSRGNIPPISYTCRPRPPRNRIQPEYSVV